MPNTKGVKGAGDPIGKPAKSVLMLRLDPATHRRFKAACGAKGCTMIGRLMSFMKDEIQSAGIPENCPG